MFQTYEFFLTDRLHSGMQYTSTLLIVLCMHVLICFAEMSTAKCLNLKWTSTNQILHCDKIYIYSICFFASLPGWMQSMFIHSVFLYMFDIYVITSCMKAKAKCNFLGMYHFLGVFFKPVNGFTAMHNIRVYIKISCKCSVTLFHVGKCV